MNLSEAKEKFPIGSMVKVTNCGGVYGGYRVWASENLSYEDYVKWGDTLFSLKNGDIAEVIAIAPHGGENRDEILVGINVKGKKPFIIDADDIEPISTVIVGEDLVVCAYGEIETFRLSEIIEELRAKCLKKKNAIKVGDKVRIVNGGLCYPSYASWLKEHADFDQAIMFDWEHMPKYGDEATVLVIAKHSDSEEKLLYLVSVKYRDITRTYLMAEDGIEKI